MSERRRTQLLAIGAFAAAIVVAAIVISQSGSDDGGGGEPSSTDVEQLFEGIPQSGLLLGDPAAPATVIEFVDMQCPFCAEFSRRALPSIIEERVRTGELALELRVLPILGPDSETAALAAAATVPQDRLWQFADLFFADQGAENSGYVTDGFIAEIYAMTPGLDPERAEADRSSAEARRLVQQNQALANRLGVDATPTLLLAEGNADPVELELGELTYEGFEEAIAAARGA
jgi:protein-disulfide isomerase